MAERDEGFLSRWSRRKVQVREGVQPPERPTDALIDDAKASTVTQSPSQTATPASAPPGERTMPVEARAQMPVNPAPASHVPAPTLEDVQALTAQSDYSVFMSRQVDPQVRNAAMKKLFHSDPHFNVMDGLDVYIDDYNKVPLLAKSELRQMMQARMLGLLDDELVEQDKPTPDPVPDHENADLQLQPHDAAEHGGVDDGTVDADAPRLDDPDAQALKRPD